jgi:tetratricopeptide (TPR) repeat protein
VRNRIVGQLVLGVCCVASGAAPALAQDAALWQKCVEGAKAAYRQQDYDRCEQLLGTALAEARKFGADDAHVGVTLHNQANLAAARGKDAEAEPLYRQALAILEKARGAEHAQAALARLGLADFLAARGRYTEAEPDYQRTLTSLEQALGPHHPIVATVLDRYALLLRHADRTAEAEKAEARAREIRAHQPAAGNHP